MGNVVISPNIKKQSDRIDPQGNIIDKRTKQIIEPVMPEYVPPVIAAQPVPEASPEATKSPVSNSLSIQEQIDEAKKNLAKLEELKKLKIAQMKAELELLEQ